MKISLIEIQNFRKLQNCHIDFDKEMTVLVGANNSGKTSAMIALRKFFTSSKSIELRDISIGNWSTIVKIGIDWENEVQPQHSLNELLPLLDTWLEVSLTKIHYIVHIIPDVNWAGGLIGVRLQYQVDDIEQLKNDYIKARAKVKLIETGSKNESKPSISPRNLLEFLEKSLSKYLVLKAYSLNPEKLVHDQFNCSSKILRVSVSHLLS